MRAPALLAAAVWIASATAVAKPQPKFVPPDVWCKAPKDFTVALEDLPGFKQRDKPRPLALTASPDIASCKAKLATDKVCRIGDIVVVQPGQVSPSGRCSHQPADVKAFYAGYQNMGQVLNLANQAVEDNYETYVVFSDFYQTTQPIPLNQDEWCGTLAFHSNFTYNKQPIVVAKGVGLTYNPAPYRLRSYIYNFRGINDWTEDELRNTQDNTTPLGILAHETEHDVCCYIPFMDPDTGTVSNQLLGHQAGHWSLYFNTYGEIMYGLNWRDEGNGTFYSIDPVLGTRPLDLYLWGLGPATAVPKMFLVDTTKQQCTPKQQTLDAIATDCPDTPLDDFDLCIDPPYARTADGECAPYEAATVQHPTGLTATGVRKNITISEIIAANGERYPSYTDSPKINTQLFILFTAPNTGMELSQKSLDRLNRYRREFNRHFYNVTQHRMRNINTYDGADDSPYWEWGGAPEWKGDTELEGWESVGLTKSLALVRGELELHLKDNRSGMTHSNLRIKADLYDTYQVVLTVPTPADGKPKLLHGAFVLKNSSGDATIPFPVYADGKKKTVAVHAPHKLLKQEECLKSRCVAVCRYANATDPKLKEKEGWYLSCPGDTGEEAEVVLKPGDCQNDDGTTACGPYCTGPNTDVTLDAGAPEGWYDSCENTLTDTYDTLTLLPVTDSEASGLKGPVLVDRIDIFNAQDMVDDDDEAKKKDGEKDWDGDGLVNAFDNCPTVANADQIDTNEDKQGDACGDFDSDGVFNALDNCPTTINSLQQDEDNDGLGDACDPDYDSGCSFQPGASRVSGRRVSGLGLIAILAVLGLLFIRRR